MPLLLPASINKAKKEFEEVNKQREELGKTREALIKASRNNDAELSQFEEQIAKHNAVLQIATQIKETYHSFIEPTKKLMKEAVEEAAAKGVGHVEVCRKGKWYTEQQEALEEVGTEYTWVLELITDFNYNIHNLTSKAKILKKADADAMPAQAQEEVRPESKERSTEEPGQNNNGENERDEEDEPAQLLNLEPQTVLKTLNTSTEGAQDMRNPTQNLLQNSMQNEMQNGTQNVMPKMQQAQWQDANGNSAFFLNRIQQLEGTINELRKIVKNLEHDKGKYKTKYHKQKDLTADAERQLWRLKEEKEEAAGMSRDQQNLLQKMEANQQQLLGALREGFSGVTIEILRAK